MSDPSSSISRPNVTVNVNAGSTTSSVLPSPSSITPSSFLAPSPGGLTRMPLGPLGPQSGLLKRHVSTGVPTNASAATDSQSGSTTPHAANAAGPFSLTRSVSDGADSNRQNRNINANYNRDNNNNNRRGESSLTSNPRDLRDNRTGSRDLRDSTRRWNDSSSTGLTGQRRDNRDYRDRDNFDANASASADSSNSGGWSTVGDRRDRRQDRRDNNTSTTNNTNAGDNFRDRSDRSERGYDNNRDRTYDRDLRERRDDRFQRTDRDGNRDRRNDNNSGTGEDRDNKDYRDRRTGGMDRDRTSWNDRDYRERASNDGGNNSGNNRYDRFNSNNHSHRGRYPSFSHDSAALHFDDASDNFDTQEEIPPSWDEPEPGCFSKSELLALFDANIARPADLHDMDGLGIVIDETLPPLAHVPLSAEEEQARANGSWLTKGFVPKVRPVRTSSISGNNQANNGGHPNSGGISSTGTRADRAHSDQAREKLPSWFDAPVSSVLDGEDASLATWSSQTSEDHQKHHHEDITAHVNASNHSMNTNQTAASTSTSTSSASSGSQWNVPQTQSSTEVHHANFNVGGQRNVSRLAAITGLDISDNGNSETTSTSTAPSTVSHVDPAWRGPSHLDGPNLTNPSAAGYGYNPSAVNPLAPSVQQPLHPHPHPHPPIINPAPAVPNQWYYKDPQGETQGPFTDEEMRDWYQKGYFDLKLRIQCNIDFSRPDAHTIRFFPLGAWFFHGKKAFLDRVPDVVERAQAAHLLQQQQAQHQAQLQAQLQAQQLQAQQLQAQQLQQHQHVPDEYRTANMRISEDPSIAWNMQQGPQQPRAINNVGLGWNMQQPQPQQQAQPHQLQQQHQHQMQQQQVYDPNMGMNQQPGWGSGPRNVDVLALLASAGINITQEMWDRLIDSQRQEIIQTLLKKQKEHAAQQQQQQQQQSHAPYGAAHPLPPHRSGYDMMQQQQQQQQQQQYGQPNANQFYGNASYDQIHTPDVQQLHQSQQQQQQQQSYLSNEQGYRYPEQVVNDAPIDAYDHEAYAEEEVVKSDANNVVQVVEPEPEASVSADPAVIAPVAVATSASSTATATTAPQPRATPPIAPWARSAVAPQASEQGRLLSLSEIQKLEQQEEEERQRRAEEAEKQRLAELAAQPKSTSGPVWGATSSTVATAPAVVAPPVTSPVRIAPASTVPTKSLAEIQAEELALAEKKQAEAAAVAKPKSVAEALRTGASLADVQPDNVPVTAPTVAATPVVAAAPTSTTTTTAAKKPLVKPTIKELGGPTPLPTREQKMKMAADREAERKRQAEIAAKEKAEEEARKRKEQLERSKQQAVKVWGTASLPPATDLRSIQAADEARRKQEEEARAARAAQEAAQAAQLAAVQGAAGAWGAPVVAAKANVPLTLKQIQELEEQVAANSASAVPTAASVVASPAPPGAWSSIAAPRQPPNMTDRSVSPTKSSSPAIDEDEDSIWGTSSSTATSTPAAPSTQSAAARLAASLTKPATPTPQQPVKSVVAAPAAAKPAANEVTPQKKPASANPTPVSTPASSSSSSSSSGSAAASSASSSGSSSDGNVFGGPQMSPEMERWCRAQFEAFPNSPDVTLAHYLMTLDSRSQIEEYIEAYLGESKQTESFTQGFLQRRDVEIQRQRKSQPAPSLSSPLPASITALAETIDKKRKKRRNK